MEMVIRHCSLLISLFCTFGLHCACAFADVVEEQRSGNWDLYNDTTISQSGGFIDGTVNVHNSLKIINNGVLTSTLNVDNNRDLQIQNTNLGTFNTNVVLGTSATVTQVIQSASDITELTGIGVGYGVLITDTTDILNWANIVGVTSGATGFILKDAKIRIDNISSINNVTINNDVIVYTNTIPNSDTLLFANVSGVGNVYVVPDDLDSLYSIQTHRVGSDMFIHLVRSTDYARVLNNNTGRFLNILREKSPDDKLFKKLDSAKTVSELNRVISKSVKTNPIKLMQPVRMMYSHKMLEMMHIEDDINLGVALFSIFSDDVFSIGLRPNANIKISDDLRVKISGYVSSLEYGDNINDYSGMSYGAGLDVLYNLPLNNFVRVYSDFGISSFDTGYVFDGNRAVKNPNGYSGVVVGEFGHRFDFGDGCYISPFVMMGGDYVSVLNSDDFDGYVGIGGDIGIGAEFDGLRYNSVIRGIGRSDGGFGAALNFSVWSVVDLVGADLELGMFYDDIIGLSYNASLNAKFSF